MADSVCKSLARQRGITHLTFLKKGGAGNLTASLAALGWRDSGSVPKSPPRDFRRKMFLSRLKRLHLLSFVVSSSHLDFLVLKLNAAVGGCLDCRTLVRGTQRQADCWIKRNIRFHWNYFGGNFSVCLDVFCALLHCIVVVEHSLFWCVLIVFISSWLSSLCLCLCVFVAFCVWVRTSLRSAAETVHTQR